MAGVPTSGEVTGTRAVVRFEFPFVAIGVRMHLRLQGLGRRSP